MAKVAVLSDVLINKIAAGEVVERPASVVKELVENALDAGATTVRVGLAGGGLRLVSVADDGHGMSREDAILAMTRHATSKLRTVDDLFGIRTMGFRGEALPAIASVSRLRLLTSEPGATVGTQVEVEGGGEVIARDAAPVGGTHIRVEELFFNTPARRKFLKSQQTELGHCEDAVIRLALAHPEVAFHVEHEGKSLFASPATKGDLRERIAGALGADIHRHLVPVEERRLGVTVHGFIARPEYNRSTARGIYTFVNRRYVRDRALNAAIQRAFGDSLPGGRQPVVVLFLEVDPRDVDVNVHPQKLEVRFQDARGVSDAVSAAILRALRETNAADAPEAAPASDPSQYALAVERFLQRAQWATADGAAPLAVADSPWARPEAARTPGFGEARPTINEAPPPGYFAQLRYIGTLARRFWLCEAQGGTLVVLDPHAAFERARFEALWARAQAGTPSEPSLFQATVDLPAVEARLLGERIDALARIGLELEPFGGTSFAVRAVPRGLEQSDLRALLLDLLPALSPEPGTETLVPALKVLACHAANGAPTEPSAEVRTALFRELDAADVHRSLRHDQVVVAELPLLELERRARGLHRDRR
ncbi:MAG: DNA mismatch repair endonuclease MutL [Myxococcaceae bacterium]|nr:DNA mismatch repair endonuclease MutL [Myxococcaceae bacterium]